MKKVTSCFVTPLRNIDRLLGIYERSVLSDTLGKGQKEVGII